MHFDTFDHYQSRSSSIHSRDPRVKVIGTALIILSNALLPDGAWLALALSWLLVVVLTLLADIQPHVILRRSLVAIPFMLAAVTVIFTIPGAALWRGPWGLVASDAGLIRFASIFMRSWISVQAAVLLLATTRFPDILHALRHLKVPAVLVSIIAFMYRYIFVLAEEARRLLRARAARSAQLPGQRSGRTVVWRAQVAGNMVGQLMLRSFERSDRVYNAMLARGYRGELLTMTPHHMLRADWLALAGLAGALLVIQLVARLV